MVRNSWGSFLQGQRRHKSAFSELEIVEIALNFVPEMLKNSSDLQKDKKLETKERIKLQLVTHPKSKLSGISQLNCTLLENPYVS